MKQQYFRFLGKTKAGAVVHLIALRIEKKSVYASEYCEKITPTHPTIIITQDKYRFLSSIAWSVPLTSQQTVLRDAKADHHLPSFLSFFLPSFLPSFLPFFLPSFLPFLTNSICQFLVIKRLLLKRLSSRRPIKPRTDTHDTDGKNRPSLPRTMGVWCSDEVLGSGNEARQPLGHHD